MLIDSIDLSDGVVKNGVIESGPAFPQELPERALKKGQLFYLSPGTEDKAQGLYVYNGEEWETSAASAPSDGGGTGGGSSIDESAYWMGA